MIFHESDDYSRPLEIKAGENDFRQRQDLCLRRSWKSYSTSCREYSRSIVRRLLRQRRGHGVRPRTGEMSAWTGRGGKRKG